MGYVAAVEVSQIPIILHNWPVGGHWVIYKHTIAFTSGNRMWKPALSECPVLMLTLGMYVYAINSGTNNWAFDKSSDLSGFALTLTFVSFS